MKVEDTSMSLTPSESPETRRGENAVRDYYDHNTNLFLKLGAGGVTRAIHQPLFMTGSMSLNDALHTHHRLVQTELESSRIPVQHVLDLGCGVGSALHYLGKALGDGIRFTGITISPKQAQKGRAWMRDSRLSNVSIECASFQDLPDELEPAELAYGIESFIHSPDAEEFMKQVSSKLVTGGRLVLFDDFLNDSIEGLYIDDFVEGWRANSLYSVAQLSDLSSVHNMKLVASRDLTQFLRLWRPRDRWVSAIRHVLPVLPLSSEYKRFLRGGNARQQLYRESRLNYSMVVFEKGTSSF